LGTLRGIAGTGPLIVAIDDVQWLDAPSVRVLSFVFRRLREDPIGSSYRSASVPTRRETRSASIARSRRRSSIGSTHGAIAIRSGQSSRTRSVAAAAVLAAAICSSFAFGRVTAPAAESTSIRPAPAVITHPADGSPLRPHQPHHRVKFGG
jgi:hypothetical protein